MSYTVRAGDSLWAIAQRWLGSGSRWHELTGWAGDPHRMPIGTVIFLPGESGPAGHPPGAATAQATADPWAGIPPEQRAAIQQLSHDYEALNNYRIPVNDGDIIGMAHNGINTAFGFAQYMWAKGISAADRAAMPWAQFGMSHDAYSQVVQQYGDLAAKYLGPDAGLDPAFLEKSLMHTQGRGDINSFMQQLTTDKNIIKTHGWVQYGMTYTDFQNFKGDSTRAFGNLSNDQAVNVLKDQHAQQAAGKTSGSEYTGGTQTAMSPKSKPTPAAGGVEQSAVR